MNSTKTLEGVEGAQLGLGIIRSLVGIDADEVQNAAVKAWTDGHMKLWQQQAGLEASGLPEPKDDDMGHSVSIGNTYYYQGAPPVDQPTTPTNPVASPPVAAVQPTAPATSAEPPVATDAPIAPVVAEPAQRRMPAWVMAAIAASGLGAAGMAGAAISEWIRTDVVDTDTDTDTQAISGFKILK